MRQSGWQMKRCAKRNNRDAIEPFNQRPLTKQADNIVMISCLSRAGKLYACSNLPKPPSATMLPM